MRVPVSISAGFGIEQERGRHKWRSEPLWRTHGQGVLDDAMLFDISPNVKQICSYAQAALDAYTFLSPDDGRDAASGYLLSLLAYLDALDDHGKDLVIAGVLPVEGGIDLERSRGDDDVVQLRRWYLNQGTVGSESP